MRTHQINITDNFVFTSKLMRYTGMIIFFAKKANHYKKSGKNGCNNMRKKSCVTRCTVHYYSDSDSDELDEDPEALESELEDEESLSVLALAFSALPALALPALPPPLP